MRAGGRVREHDRVSRGLYLSTSILLFSLLLLSACAAATEPDTTEGPGSRPKLLPDFSVSRDDIALSSQNPQEGENVTVLVTVHNKGNIRGRVEVRLSEKLNTSENFTKFYDRWFGIPRLSSLTIETTWVAKPGNNTLRVWLSDSRPTERPFMFWNNVASTQVHVEEPAPPAEAPVEARPTISYEASPIHAAVSVGMASLVLVFFTFVKKNSWLLPAVFPMFTRIRRNELLDNETRNDLHDYINENPGCHLSELMESLGRQSGVVTYHLKKLQDAGLVHSMKDGRFRRFYTDRLHMESHVLCRREEEILDIIRTEEGVSQKMLTERLDISPQLVNYYIRKLRENGLVRLKRNGKSSSCHMK